MEKFVAVMIEAGREFKQTVIADDVFEADKQAQELAKRNNWLHIETRPKFK